MDKVWEIKDPDEYLKPRKTGQRFPASREAPHGPIPCPCWWGGAGQSYNESTARPSSSKCCWSRCSSGALLP